MSFGQYQFRGGTAAAWTSANPTLLSREFGVETDTHQFKLGDGVTAWNSLAYGGIQGPQGIQGLTGTTGSIGTRGSLWYEGAGSPGAIGGQLNNDMYLNTSNSDVWQLLAGTWTNIGNIKGATGSVGPTNITALTGDVTASGSGSVAATITAAAVTNSKMANMAATTVKGSVAGGVPADLSQAQLTALLNPTTLSLPGSMSASDKKKLNLHIYDVVADYGADPTGATNSATAIQNAVNAAQIAGYSGGSGGIIWFPAGRYLIGSTIKVTGNNIRFWGPGAGSSQDFGNYFTGFGAALVPTSTIMGVQVLPVQTNGLAGQTNTGFKWQGLAVDCYANNGTFGLQLLSCVNFDVDDFYAINATNTGLDFNTLPAAVTTGSTVWTTNTAPTTIKDRKSVV